MQHIQLGESVIRFVEETLSSLPALDSALPATSESTSAYVHQCDCQGGTTGTGCQGCSGSCGLSWG